mgnify:CR=1 FL=1
MGERITIVVADRQALFRAGVREALSSQRDIEVTECEPNGEVITFIKASSPNMVLLDIDFPSLSGLDLARQIGRHSPTTKIIMLSSCPDDSQLFQAIKVGAAAYLNKDIIAEELAATIRKVYRGAYPINDSVIARPGVAEQVLKQFQELSLIGKGIETVAAPLTARETEVLGHIADGNTNRQIADILHISEQTIKNHITSILRKLNANDRAHAVVLAIRHGWISLE